MSAISLFFTVFHWPTTLKLGCFTNFDMLGLVMGFICLVHEIIFMLISIRHFEIRPFVHDWTLYSHTKRTYLYIRGDGGVAHKLKNIFGQAKSHNKFITGRSFDLFGPFGEFGTSGPMGVALGTQKF